MVAKPAGYVGAKAISDLAAMRAVEDFCVSRSVHPIDALVAQGFLKKVAAAKLHKLEKRGWVTKDYALLRAGSDFLAENLQ